MHITQTTTKKTAAAFIATAGMLLGSLTLADDAGAQTSDAAQFACDGTPYVMQNGDLFAVSQDPANPDAFIYEAINDSTTFGNSLAFDPVSRFIFGVRSNKFIETYDAAGNVISSVAPQAPWPGGSSYAGTTLGDGRYVAATYNADYEGSANNLWEVDPATGAVRHIGPLSTRHADFAFNPSDGYLYHVSGGRLYKIDPRDASETVIPLTSGLSNHGASWFDAAGNLYVHHNSSGRLYQIVGIGSEETATWRLAGQADPVSGSDGANCIGGIELEQQITDSNGNPLIGDSREVRPGDTIRSDYTIYNNEPTRELTVCDRLGNSGLRFSGAASDTTGAGLFQSIGNDGSSFCYTVTSESNLYIDPDSGAAEPVTISVEISIPSDQASPTEVLTQGWISLDGDPASKDVPADDASTGTRDDATVFTVVSNQDPEMATYEVTDAGIGTGPTCPATPDESMAPAVQLDSIPRVDVDTTLLSTDFNEDPGFKVLAGSWMTEGGAYNQVNTCGFDYSSLYLEQAVEHFRWEATFHSVDSPNAGGIVFNQTVDYSRSGASIVDLTNDGTTLRWGTYDSNGYYNGQGSLEIEQVTPGTTVSVAVEVRGKEAQVFLNGEEVASLTNSNQRGYVGLVASQSAVAFESAELTALAR